MTRDELGQSLNLEEYLIPQDNANRTGRQLIPGAIAIHNTDNFDRGADARAHSGHLINNAGDSGYGPTSWHYTVDDSRVVKHLPLGERGIHAYTSGNKVSLGIEMCVNSDGNWEATVDRTARLVAALCFDFGWDMTAVKQHHDFPKVNGNQKNCPSQIRGGNLEPNWAGFLNLCQSYLNELLSSEGFTEGFVFNKQIAATTLSAPTNEDFDNDDRDHGKIVIPSNLLNPKNQ